MNNETFKYSRYLNINQETRWATMDEMKASCHRIDLNADFYEGDGEYSGGGIPILSNGQEAYVDNKDTHTLIFGATGSKKTRLFCMPLIDILAKAGESFVVADPKGELYEKTSGLAKANGYNIVVLNFRDIGKGDMWNPLSLPFDLYHSGNKEAAISIINDFIAAISAPIRSKSTDVYWAEMASAFALGNLYTLLECGERDECNIFNFSRLCSGENVGMLREFARIIGTDSIPGIQYSMVMNTPEKTYDCILSTLFGMVRIFNTQPTLAKMLSASSFDIRRFGKEKTAVYVIVPDEKTTYHFLVTLFIKQVYEIQVEEAQREKKRCLPVRLNFLLDEFCNIPTIPDMPAMVSAARSRNMRFYLVAQSMHQLTGKYKEDAETIKGNCENWIFLTSKELSLLNEISELCGTVYSADNRQRRLISVSELQRLDKSKGEALIMHARQYPSISEFPDIQSYTMFNGYTPPSFYEMAIPEIPQFMLENLIFDIRHRNIPVPFSNGRYYGDEMEEQGKDSSYFNTDNDGHEDLI